MKKRSILDAAREAKAKKAAAGEVTLPPGKQGVLAKVPNDDPVKQVCVFLNEEGKPEPPKKGPRNPRKPKPGAPVPIDHEGVKVACGHTIPFPLYEKDKDREQRRAFVMGIPCRACRNAKKHSKKITKICARLPHGSRVEAVYDAGKEEWIGSLTVQGKTFHGKQSSQIGLFQSLDKLYRAAQPPEEPPPPEKVVIV